MMIDQQQVGFSPYMMAALDEKCSSADTTANLTTPANGGADRLSCPAATTTQQQQQQQSHQLHYQHHQHHHHHQQQPLSSTTPNIPHPHPNHPIHNTTANNPDATAAGGGLHNCNGGGGGAGGAGGGGGGAHPIVSCPDATLLQNQAHPHHHHHHHHYGHPVSQNLPHANHPQSHTHHQQLQQHDQSHPMHAIDTAASAASPAAVTAAGAAAVAAAALLLTDTCGACNGALVDRFIMRVSDALYHERCLQCTTCGSRLADSCFTRDGKLYCRLDYERLFLKIHCLSCGDRICSGELVMRTAENVFHLKCFACVVCGVQLQKGEQYVVKQCQLFCRSDYEKEVEMLQGYNEFVDDYCPEDSAVFPSKVDGRRGPKRPRTILNTQQRRAFRASFDLSPKPCRKVRETLAKETGLSLRIVQVWFQNQRAKVKKIQKKARQENTNGGGGNSKGCNSETESLGESSLEHDSRIIKDENESDGESSAYMHAPLMECVDPKGTPIKLERSGDADSAECYKKAMVLYGSLQSGYKDSAGPISQDGAAGAAGAGAGGVAGVADCGSGNMNLNTIMGLAYSEFQQLMSSTSMSSPTTSPLQPHLPPNSMLMPAIAAIGAAGRAGAGMVDGPPGLGGPHHPILNPIDRLYSMQNAYFRCEEAARIQHQHSSIGDDEMEH